VIGLGDYGVVGTSRVPGPTGVGVLGSAPGGIGPVDMQHGGIGVHGRVLDVQGEPGRGTGVLGTTTLGFGVVGEGEMGVLGSGRTGSTGVLGLAPDGTGVRGDGGTFGTGVVGTGGTGLRGETANGEGVTGTSSDAGTGVSGSSPRGVGVYGASPDGLAGRFDGAVLIDGPLTVRGAAAAAVPHPDGSLRRVQPLAAPEGYLEDFGEGRLVNGQARVALDPDLAALVRGDAYHVFLTDYGDSRGLYVDARSPAGFEVRERQGGTSSVAFGYRVVAKRRDAAGPRLERIDRPTPRPLRATGAPPPPEIPEPPPPPELPPRPGPPDRRP
jgi:hypothetical protein